MADKDFLDYAKQVRDSSRNGMGNNHRVLAEIDPDVYMSICAMLTARGDEASADNVMKEIRANFPAYRTSYDLHKNHLIKVN